MHRSCDPRNPSRWLNVGIGAFFTFALACLALALCDAARAQSGSCVWHVQDGSGATYSLPVPSNVSNLCAVKAAEWAAAAPGGGYTVHYCEQTTGPLAGHYSVTWTDANTYTFTFYGDPGCAGGEGTDPPAQPASSPVESFGADPLANVVAVCGVLVLFALGYIGGRLR